MTATEQPVLPERRADSIAIVTLVQLVHDDVKLLRGELTAVDSKLDAHMTDETLTLAEEIVKLMGRAFPDGDPDGHKRAHEAMIKKAEDSAAFWKQMRTKLSEWGLVGFCGWLLYAAWDAVLRGHK